MWQVETCPHFQAREDILHAAQDLAAHGDPEVGMDPPVRGLAAARPQEMRRTELAGRRLDRLFSRDAPRHDTRRAERCVEPGRRDVTDELARESLYVED